MSLAWNLPDDVLFETSLSVNYDAMKGFQVIPKVVGPRPMLDFCLALPMVAAVSRSSRVVDVLHMPVKVIGRPKALLVVFACRLRAAMWPLVSVDMFPKHRPLELD